MNSEPLPDLEPCRPTGNPNKTRSGIGMPASLYLHQFGDILFQAFGDTAYQVGSSLTGATWRDVDVRVIMDDEKYAAMGFGDPKRPQENPRWSAYTMAFSELGRKMTGLPIDFQIQQMTAANAENHGDRSALVFATLRRQSSNPSTESISSTPSIDPTAPLGVGHAFCKWCGYSVQGQLAKTEPVFCSPKCVEKYHEFRAKQQ